MTTPNQAKQRIASRAAFDFQRVCHPPFGCVICCIGLAVDDSGVSLGHCVAA
jgi:hypothetical protein